MNFDKLPLSNWIDAIVEWLRVHWKPLFDLVSGIIQPTVDFFHRFFLIMPPILTILLITLVTWWLTRKRIALFTFFGLLLIENLGYWQDSVETLSLVLTATFISIIIGIPLGLWSGKSQKVQRVIYPILDFMQTMPAFVYLIPAVFFFSLGTIPGVFASVIFAMPPTIRFTNLGLRQVPTELKEAADAFGSTPLQKLWKVEIPLAKQTILAGINQTIMLSLSMVVVASMIGAGGLGEIVLQSISRLQVGNGFEAGLSIVIIAIILDRLTQNISGDKPKWMKWIGITLSAVMVCLAVVSMYQGGKETEKKVTLAYVNWDTEIASTHVVKHVLKSQGYQVDMKQVEAAPMWQGVASGVVDAHVAAWLPNTSKPQMDAFKNKVENLGVNLKGAKVGLVAPKYVTIDSINQLNDTKSQFDEKIVGIDAGAGVMKNAETAIKKYNLDFQLLKGSDAAMTASLAKAIEKKKWIVVTGWTPHWKFAKFKLKYLKDPKGAFGSQEGIYTIARKGLKKDKPHVYHILDRFQWSIKDMEEVMIQIHNGKKPDVAAKEWIKKNPKKVNKWIGKK